MFLRGACSGQHPINAAYLSPDLPLEAGLQISAKQSPGNHQSCILEIRWKSLVGKDLFKNAHPDARQLLTAIHQLTVDYKQILLKQEAQHKLIHKTHALYKGQHGPLSLHQQWRLELIDTF
jgi:hypothetical protein